MTETARAKCEESPKHPDYLRPAPQARRRTWRKQGARQKSKTEGEADQEQVRTP